MAGVYAWMGAPAEYKVRFYENGKDLIIVSRLVGPLQCLAGYYHMKDGHLLDTMFS